MRPSDIYKFSREALLTHLKVEGWRITGFREPIYHSIEAIDNDWYIPYWSMQPILGMVSIHNGSKLRLIVERVK